MVPRRSNYSPNIHALIRRLRTPRQVQRWLVTLDYNTDETMHSLHGVVRRHRAHCLEAAMTTAAILEQHGYPPLILDLESADQLDHTLFLFRHRGKFGTVGLSRDRGLNGRRPVFSTIRALVQSYLIPYVDERAAISAFGVLDLRTLKNQRWRTSGSSVWYVEEALRRIPHDRASLPPKTLARWRRRFHAWKKDHPGRQPDYYPGQSKWMS